jgi:hypothetical protein
MGNLSIMLTLEQLKKAALTSKQQNKHIYLVEEQREVKIQITSQFLHHDTNFQYIAGLTPDGILKDYGIYNGWEMGINQLLKQINEDYKGA